MKMIKKYFFQNILNNTRLPNLINERELVKQELLVADKHSSESLLLKFQNLNNEINNIQNKKID